MLRLPDWPLNTNGKTDYRMLQNLVVIVAALSEKHPNTAINSETEIFGSGLADSQMFFDIVMEVERKTGLMFNPDALGFEGEMTPSKMATAFKLP